MPETSPANGRRRFPLRGPAAIVFARDLRHTVYVEYAEVERSAALITVLHPDGRMISWPTRDVARVVWLAE